MNREFSLAAPNSLILIMDHLFGEIPESMDGNLVAATKSCIAVSTALAFEQNTRVIISDEETPNTEGLILVFDGFIQTPKRRLQLCNVYMEVICEIEMKTVDSPVKIYANEETEPSEIVILI